MLGRFMNNIAPCATLVHIMCSVSCTLPWLLAGPLPNFLESVCSSCLHSHSHKQACKRLIRGHQLPTPQLHHRYPACPPKKHRNAAPVERLLHPRDAHHVNLCGIVTGNVKVCGSLLMFYFFTSIVDASCTGTSSSP